MSSEFYSRFVGTLFKRISHVSEFAKDMKKLKRFSSLEEDLRWKGIDSAGMVKERGWDCEGEGNISGSYFLF